MERIERYECSGCLANFTRKSALEKHKTDCEDFRLKGKPPPTVDLSDVTPRFPCEMCDKSYTSRQAILMHIKRAHNKDSK